MIGGEGDRATRTTSEQTGYGLVVCHIRKATAAGYRALVCGQIQDDDIFSVSLVIDPGSIEGDTADGTLYIEMRGLPQPIIDKECEFLATRLTADKTEACLGLEAVTMMREVAAMIRNGRVPGILRANRWSDFSGLFVGN